MDEKTFDQYTPHSLLIVLWGYLQKHFRAVVATILLLSLYLTTIYVLSAIETSFTAITARQSAIALLDILVFSGFVFSIRHFRKSKSFIFVAILGLYLFVRIIALHFGYTVPGTIKGFNSRWEYILALQYAFLLLFFIYFRKQLILREPAKFNTLLSDCFLILILCYPLLNYLSHNLDFIAVYPVALFFLLLLGTPLTLLLLTRSFQKQYLSLNFLVPTLVSFFFVYYSMPMYTSLLEMPAESNIFYHLSILVCVTLFLVFLYHQEGKLLSYLVIILLFTSIIESALTLNNDVPVDKGTIEKSLPDYLSVELKQKPDIYLLVYDAYVGRDLMNYYGIDNEKHMQYLADQGFQLYENLYTLYPSSLGSMSRVLDMSADTEPSPQEIIAGQSAVNKFLQREGYETHYLLSPYLMMGAPMLGDYSYPSLDSGKSYGTGHWS